MQWADKIQFHGQVKTAGLEKSMQWKTGHVDFDFDADSKNWKVKLFFKVNPTRVSHEIVIKGSVKLSLKAGRLIIEDKKGNGIHIRLTSNDTAAAKALISLIEKSEPIGQNQNKAEVGLTLKSSSQNRKSSENVSPFEPSPQSLAGHNKSIINRPSLQEGTDKQQLIHTPGQPPNANQIAGSNRLEKAQNSRDNGLGSSNKRNLQRDQGNLEEEEGTVTHGKFTGVKDISKRTPQLCNGTTPSGLGTKTFYGSHNTSSSLDHSNRSVASLPDRSPRLKKAKLGLSDRDSYQSPPSSLSIGGVSRKMSAMVPDQLRKSDGSPRQDDGEAMQCQPRTSGDGPSQITVGFDNLGNTCFMNSPLQCLSSLEPLSIDFQTAVMQYGPELKPLSMTRLLYYLMKDVRKLDVCPERVRQILVRLRHDINGKFALNTQQDAHELLAELLDRTDEEMKSVMRNQEMPAASPEGAASSSLKNTPRSAGTPIETNFMYFYKTSFFFHECKTEVTSQQEQRDTTLILALDSNKDSNLQDCIDRYFESSEVDMRCEKCGKEEKATMTRKIVRRPRIFILNLLRYQTDNAESKKKMDRVAISSYMSVAEYCAEDVKAPPHMEPVFMLDRLSSSSSKNQKFEADLPYLLEPDLKVPASSHSADLAKEDGPPKEESQALEQADQRQAKKVVLIEPEKEEELSVSEVEITAQTLIEKFWEVDKYIQEFGVDLDFLYLETRAVISEVNQFVEKMKRGVEAAEEPRQTNSTEDSGYSQENQLALCHTLINRALYSDTCSDVVLDTRDTALICKEILINRYGSYTLEDKKVNHLIEDLGLYLAAKKLSIAKPDTPKKKPRVDQDSAASAGGCEFPLDNNEPTDVKNDSQLAEAGSDEEVTFKSSLSKVETKKQEMETEPPWDEDQYQGLDKDEGMKTMDNEPSTSYTSAQQIEHQYFNADVPSNQLQGKDIGLYTEEELQGIDVGSLTEDEMLLYAQALSSFEYLKESQSKHNKQDDDMELSDYEDGPNMDTEDSKQPSDEIWISRPSEAKASVELPQKKPVLSPSQQQQGVHKKLKLICEEDLCDLDEVDGVKGTQQPKVLAKDWPDKMSTVHPLLDHHWSDLEASIPKYCDFCNEVFEDECISCSVMNQPGLEPGSLHAAEKDINSRDKTDSKQKGPRVLADKCNTPPEKNKLPRLNDKDNGVLSSGASQALKLIPLPAADTSFKQSDSDHVVPSCSTQPSPKAEKFLFSPSKPNNLTKSRDYSRLRSPSASPRKKNKRHVRSSSASKRLLFPGDDRGDKNEGLSYLDDGSFHDHDLDTSLEVNIGESSFDNREDSFMTPVPPYSSRLGLTSSPFLPSLSKSSTNVAVITPKTAAARKLDPRPMDSTHFSPAQVLQLNQSQAEPAKETKHMASPPVKHEPATSNDRLVESKGERLQMSARWKSPRSCTNLEEKENGPADQARSKRMENIEVGKADYSYRLVGIVNHHGESLYAGHYTAFAYNLSKQKWFYMDDKHTRETSETIAKRDSLHSGYVFFYMDKELFHQYATKARSKRMENIEVGKADYSYRLVGIVNHHGESLYAGHYTAFAYNLSKQKWFYMDDKHTRETSETIAKRDSLHSGYVFFYMDKELFHQYATKARSKRMENIEVGKADYSYRLVGIVNHHGESLYAGHYTAFAYNLSKQKWFYMDDKHTRETSETIAKRDSLHSGYVFFYMDKELFHQYATKVRETTSPKKFT